MLDSGCDDCALVEFAMMEKIAHCAACGGEGCGWCRTTKPPPSKAFDGETYEPSVDYERLNGQLGRVYALMKDAQWRTLSEIADQVGGSEAAVSARLRDFRKPKYGSLIVEKSRIGGGLFRYRLLHDLPRR